MSTRVSGSLLLLIALVFAFNVGDFAAQDPAQTMPATQSTQTDLSGTYTGAFNCEAAGLMGDTTLTITGNQFTTADGKSGRIVASTTGGYTAVAMQMGEMTPAATGTTGGATAMPQIISLRARKSGERLTLTSVSGSMQKCTFTPTRATARGRRNQRTPAATGTEVGNPASVPVPTTTPTEMPVPEQTPSPMPSPSPEASPEPNPSPSPQPTQMPTPFPNPSPSPTASPSPTPSPTPSPAGQHRR
ncbi:MAG TPA: hypothetical protein VJT15_22575 [Pyrinomonadaceae bacterium]|nr:hypothetical protein [Pyrinomonadaceae bacterium]